MNFSRLIFINFLVVALPFGVESADDISDSYLSQQQQQTAFTNSEEEHQPLAFQSNENSDAPGGVPVVTEPNLAINENMESPYADDAESMSSSFGGGLASFDWFLDYSGWNSGNWDLWSFDDYVYLGFTEGRGLSYHRGYTTLGVFYSIPYFQHCGFFPFIDARGHIFNDGKGAANLGVGLRYMLNRWDAVAGVNMYYDYRKFRDHHFNQIGIGFELLSAWFDFRLNTYFPVGSVNQHKSRLFDFGDDFFAVRSKRVQAYKGFDAELGIWLVRKTPCNFFGLYVAAGPYYYTASKHNSVERSHHSFTGGRMRILARINEHIDVSLIGTYDDFFHGTLQGQINFYASFSEIMSITSVCAAESCCCRELPCLMDQIAMQPVDRNEIIVADPYCTWLWNWPDACCCSDCDYESSCRSSSDGYSGGYQSRSWDSHRFSSDSFPFPYYCSERGDSSSGYNDYRSHYRNSSSDSSDY